jgi:hypothetical protein
MVLVTRDGREDHRAEAEETGAGNGEDEESHGRILQARQAVEREGDGGRREQLLLPATLRGTTVAR